MYAVAADIEISGLSNNHWPDWNNICNANISGQPDHPWLKPTSSNQSISLDSDSPPEDEDNNGHDAGASVGVVGQSAMTSKGKQTAPVGTDDDNERTTPPTTPKGKQQWVDVMPAPAKSALKKSSSQPFRIGPPGQGKIKGSSATTSSKGEQEPSQSGGVHKGKAKAISEEGADEDRPSKLVPLSGNRLGKGKARAQTSVTMHGRGEEQLGPSGGDRKGKARAVVEEMPDEGQPSKPIHSSNDHPSKGKPRAQTNLANYALPIKEKGLEKTSNEKDGVAAKGRRTQGGGGDDREDGNMADEPRGRSRQRELKGG